MKLYIVTKGHYSAYHIEAVFKSLRKAELYLAARKNKPGSDYNEIEEYETSDEKITDKNEVIGYIFRAIYDFRNKRWVLPEDPEDLDGVLQYEPDPETLTQNMIWIPENDPIKAQKILQDRITQLNAEIAGI